MENIKNLRLYCRHARFLELWPRRQETPATSIRLLIDEAIVREETVFAFKALLDGTLHPDNPRRSLRVTPDMALAAFGLMNGNASSLTEAAEDLDEARQMEGV